MGKQFIILSSITYAYKAKDILERKGCKAFIEKAPRSISECGCLYSLVIRGCTLEKATSFLKAANIKIIRTGSDEDDLS
jgi:hypothetical protein